MAQSEDAELRDLVIEALEKNGSLAKIRALLRANVFLAFEDNCENIKQNASLDSVLKLPEGILSLSIIHEFLEFCNLKNTLFVYTAESRQNKEYLYEGRKKLTEKLSLPKRENCSEPFLVTLIKNLRRHHDQSDDNNLKKSASNNNVNEDNCTYIVHEDSSGSGTSNSDNSSDDKNKLHLRLQLDNSDTDTSSDSTRDKSSEYIPSKHIIPTSHHIRSNRDNSKLQDLHVGKGDNQSLTHLSYKSQLKKNYILEPKLTNNSSSDSTSYLELKPFSVHDEKLLNTTGVPVLDFDEKIDLNSEKSSCSKKHSEDCVHKEKDDSVSPVFKNEDQRSKTENSPNTVDLLKKSEGDTEYSDDFSSPPMKNDLIMDKDSPSVHEDCSLKSSSKNSPMNSPHQHSQSSQSSVSISDVADLISEKSLSFSQPMKNENILSDRSKSGDGYSKKQSNEKNKLSDDSGDFSESPVPSLSNLSLDIHSD